MVVVVNVARVLGGIFFDYLIAFWFKQIFISTKEGLGIYAPIFLVSAILFRRKKYVLLVV